MQNLVTFHGDVKIKNKYLKRVKAHYEADEIIHGVYWEEGKGCAVGCTIEGNDHNKYETELGIPAEVAYLEDVIFESLKNEESKEFPLQFLKAVGVGKDLSKITAQVVIWQFEDKKYGLKNIPEAIEGKEEDKEVMGWCDEIVALYKRDLKDNRASEQEYYDLYLKIDRAGAGAGAGAWAWAWAGARAWAWARAGARAWAWAWAGARAWAWAGAGARAWAGNERNLALRDYFLKIIKEAPKAK